MKIERIGKTAATLVTKRSGDQVLVSYSTPVAAYIMTGYRDDETGEYINSGFYRTKEKFSSTTSKQINKWLREENVADKTTEKDQSFFDGLL